MVHLQLLAQNIRRGAVIQVRVGQDDFLDQCASICRHGVQDAIDIATGVDDGGLASWPDTLMMEQFCW